MGAIQNSFNQLLGISAAAGATVGKQISDERKNQKSLGNKIEDLESAKKNFEVSNTLAEHELESDIDRKATDLIMAEKDKDELNYKLEKIGSNKRLKNSYVGQTSLKSLLEQIQEKDSQIKGFRERLDILNEKRGNMRIEGKYKLAEFDRNINTLKEEKNLATETFKKGLFAKGGKK